MFVCKRFPFIIVGALGGILTAIFGALCGWVIFPALIKLNIEKQTALVNGTEQYERWVNLPQPLNFKVYLFNVTNAEDVLDGAMPIVNEIGPYVYLQYRNKIVSNISPDKSIVTFRTIQNYVFDHKASAPLTENDNLVLLNAQLNSFFQIAEHIFKKAIKDIGHEVNKSIEQTAIISTLKHVLVSMSTKVKRMPPQDQSLLQSAESSMPGQLGFIDANVKDVFGKKYNSMFMSVKPSEVLFNGIPMCTNVSGLGRLICSTIKGRKVKTMREMKDGSVRFSFFGHKNATDEGVFAMHTGVGDMSKLGQILSWNRHSTVQTWLNRTDGGASTCNMINGTDTTVFSPHKVPHGTEYIFSTDICRSVQVFYKENVNFNGIPALRYQVGDNFLNQIGIEYGSECFCVNRIENVPAHSNGCLYRGAMDLTTCQGTVEYRE